MIPLLAPILAGGTAAAAAAPVAAGGAAAGAAGAGTAAAAAPVAAGTTGAAAGGKGLLAGLPDVKAGARLAGGLKGGAGTEFLGATEASGTRKEQAGAQVAAAQKMQREVLDRLYSRGRRARERTFEDEPE